MKTILTSLVLGSVLVSGAALADTKYNLVPAGTAKFTPADPKNPAGIQMSVVAGDPKTGPVTFFLKLGKGAAPIHWHTSDYSAVVVEGQTKHWLPGKEADAKAGGPGTAWFQPGGATPRKPTATSALSDSLHDLHRHAEEVRHDRRHRQGRDAAAEEVVARATRRRRR